MSDRFTPLYVIKIFLDMLYHQNKNIVIPEALLECSSFVEEHLREDLRKIDSIANSGDVKKINTYLTSKYNITYDTEICTRYDTIYSVLFCGMERDFYENAEYVYENAEDFMSDFKTPSVINYDVLKDLIPTRRFMMSGIYEWGSIFDCIFKYILYTKTKHLCLFDQSKLCFKPLFLSWCLYVDTMEDDFIFNY